MNEIVIDITELIQSFLGNFVTYAALTTSKERDKNQNMLIEKEENSVIFNPDWDGNIYILFESGSELEVSGSDYVSICIRNVEHI